MAGRVQTTQMIIDYFRSMDPQALDKAKYLIAQEEINRKEEIVNTYGPTLCKIVGVEKIYFLSQVEAKELDLQDDSAKYPMNTVKPSMLNVPAVRGVTGKNRPFIAIKIEMLDPATKKVIATVVELIFKRYSLKSDGGKGALYENNYVTALHNTSEKGPSFSSCLYASGGMTEVQITAVKNLLEGKEIKAPQGDYLIRMSKK